MRRIPLTLLCQLCQKPFRISQSKLDESAGKRGKFCSRSCFYLAKRYGNHITILCEQCHQPFSVMPSSAHHRFCSEACYNNRPKKRLSLMCRHCGQTFEVPPSREHRKFCCKACKYADGYKNKNRRTCANPSCEKIFAVFPHESDKKKFCSRECAKTKAAVICQHCGETFIHYTSRRFCSRRCSAMHLRRPEETRRLAQRANVKKRRARKRNAPISDFTAEQWEAMKIHYGHRCVYCDQDCQACRRKTHILTQDHVMPLSKGGSHTVSNSVPACRDCNFKKRTGPPLVPVQPLLFAL
jgi:endogenous inhibitor of DNA gyrase (YacG/DUF329 family)